MHLIFFYFGLNLSQSHCHWSINVLNITIITVVSVYWLCKWIHSFTKSVLLYFIQLNWILTSQIFIFFWNICEVSIQFNCITNYNTDFVNEWINLRSQFTLTTVIIFCTNEGGGFHLGALSFWNINYCIYFVILLKMFSYRKISHF